jgi:hypothetical protein
MAATPTAPATTASAALAQQATPAVLPILQAIADAQAQIKQWEDHKAACLLQLQQAHDQGLCTSKVTGAGVTASLSPGRTTNTPDAIAKEAQKQQQQQLIAAGHIVQTQGSPYWTVRKAAGGAAAA